jgi:hypothetical protein
VCELHDNPGSARVSAAGERSSRSHTSLEFAFRRFQLQHESITPESLSEKEKEGALSANLKQLNSESVLLIGLG